MLLAHADLAPFATIDAAKAAAMIEDAEALAGAVAPCLRHADFPASDYAAAAKAILRGAVLRWHDSGSGAVSQQTAGPFSVALDTRADRRAMFWPSEIAQLQSLCAMFNDSPAAAGAFELDTTPAAASAVPLNWWELNIPAPPWSQP